MDGVTFQLGMFGSGTHMKHKFMKKYAGVGQFPLRLNMRKR